MEDAIVNQIIKQEVQLLDKIDSIEVLAELIDNEFIEIGSSAVIYDKAEILRWRFIRSWASSGFSISCIRS